MFASVSSLAAPVRTLGGQLTIWTVFAQAAAQAEPPGWAAFAPFVLIAVVAYVLLFLPQQKERASRQRLLDSLKKNDRVVTIGGMLGTVSNISNDGKEVTLKVDDNTRIRFRRNSILEIQTGEDPATKPSG